jgi:hypothetical protein
VNLQDIIESKQNARHALREHIKQGIPLHDSVFRYQSEAYFETFRLAREMLQQGLLEDLDWESQEMLETDLGKKVVVRGLGEVYLDCPYIAEEDLSEAPGMIRKIAAALGVTAALYVGGDFMGTQNTPLGQAMSQAAQEGDQIAEKYLENLDHIAENDPAMLVKLSNKYLHKNNKLDEAEYQGKDVELNKPKRGGSKKFYVYTKNSKTGKIKKVSFGADSGGGKLAVKLKDPQARKAFADRHNCEQKNDKTKPGYWSCRLPRYAKSLGLSGGGTWW